MTLLLFKYKFFMSSVLNFKDSAKEYIFFSIDKYCNSFTVNKY
jgi:hypothetical protein